MGIDEQLRQELSRIMDQHVQTHDALEQLWATKIVFTWHWWLDVALTVLPWILWIIVRNKKNSSSLLCAAIFTMLAATLLDMVGVSQDNWSYNTLLLPYLPEFLPWDLAVMPVAAMLFYQFLPKINPWLKGVAFGVIAAYVVEPIFMAIGLYETSNWELHYSLPIYFAIFMIGYWLYIKNRKEINFEWHGGVFGKGTAELARR